MAKKSQVAREKKRAKLNARYKEKRDGLIETIKNPETSMEDRREAYRMLSNLPRNASPTRLKNRCNLTGRSHGYLRKFGMSRIAFRQYALRGQIPGVTKSSW
ncbi:MAG: 30S ribosomal protein S14 [Deltaproteobacteria bacterium]|nr:MAG: 30S ribosomal protein S14 [Deltaproteobacteria bacterium]